MFREHAMEDGSTGSSGSNHDYRTPVFHQQPLSSCSKTLRKLKHGTI
jgi:hypothetical protein